MTPPTGYRLATADDLTEGAEVLIPATIGDGYARISVRSNRPAADTYISAPRLPGIALVRDDAAPESTVGTGAPPFALPSDALDPYRRPDPAAYRDALRYALAIPLDQPMPSDPVAAAQHHAGMVADLRARAEKAEADLLDLHSDLAARDLMVAASDRLRRDLANATDAALRSALTTGSLSEAIRVAGVLCGIDAADPFAGLSALVDRARGGR